MQAKPGISSTQFWGKVVVSILGVVMVLFEHLEPNYYWAALVAIWTVYGIQRNNLQSQIIRNNNKDPIAATESTD